MQHKIGRAWTKRSIQQKRWAGAAVSFAHHSMVPYMGSLTSLLLRLLLCVTELPAFACRTRILGKGRCCSCLFHKSVSWLHSTAEDCAGCAFHNLSSPAEERSHLMAAKAVKVISKACRAQRTTHMCTVTSARPFQRKRSRAALPACLATGSLCGQQ